VGRKDSIGDLSVQVVDGPLQVELGQSIKVPVQVKSSFKSDQLVTVSCWRQGVLVESRKVQVSSGAKQVDFDLTPVLAGQRVYRFSIASQLPDARPENDVSYAVVKVEKSPLTKILFLTASPTVQFKFLSRWALRQKQVEVTRLFQLSSKVLFKNGPAEGLADLKEKWPTNEEFYSQFDVIVTDVVGMNRFSNMFKDFMSKRGGGVIVLGNPSELNGENQRLIPAKSWRLQRNMVSHSLKVGDEQIFPEPVNELLYSSFGLRLMKYHSFTEFDQVLSYARKPLVLDESGSALVLAHQYGGGRLVVMNYPKNWRWQLKLSPSEHYKSFWSGLVSWLSSATKPRVEQLFNGTKLPLNQSVPLKMLVRNPRYEKSNMGEVSLMITSPHGDVVDLSLSPVMNDLGHYQEDFIASEVGEYRVESMVKFGKEDVVETSGSFLVVPNSKEYREVEVNSQLLQDVSRITQGDFYARLPVALKPLKVGGALPKSTVKHFWFDSLFLPFVLLGLLLMDVYVRRRIGLK
jgi:hypothetical protein